MLNEKDYCDLETVKELESLGMNIYTSFNGVNVVRNILLYEAQKWLREEKGIIVGIINNFTIQAFDYYVSTWEEDRCRGNKYTSYEDALQRGIKKAIKILKEATV